MRLPARPGARWGAAPRGLDTHRRMGEGSTQVSYRGKASGGLSLPRLVCYPARVEPTPAAPLRCGAPARCATPPACCLLQVSPPRPSSGCGSSPLRSTTMRYSAPMMSSAHELCRALSPVCEGMPSVTRTEITQEIQKLTEEIRTLSYSSTKAAAEKILHLQQRRRELRAQLEAAAPYGATAGVVVRGEACSTVHARGGCARYTRRATAPAPHRWHPRDHRWDAGGATRRPLGGGAASPLVAALRAVAGACRSVAQTRRHARPSPASGSPVPPLLRRPKPNTSTMSRQLPGTRCQATSCDVVMCSGIVNVFLVSGRL